MGEPRRIWHSIQFPVDLHAALTDRCGHRGLTAAVAEALEHLAQQPGVPKRERPSRDHGTVEISLRLPVGVADTADRWRVANGLSRQATVEYAVLAALEVVS
ncbi:MAG: hypothetical protein ACYCU7_09185 [Acidimicrobiales bacterium]